MLPVVTQDNLDTLIEDLKKANPLNPSNQLPFTMAGGLGGGLLGLAAGRYYDVPDILSAPSGALAGGVLANLISRLYSEQPKTEKMANLSNIAESVLKKMRLHY